MLDGYFYQNQPITPESAAAKRKLAQALQRQGMDFSPVRSGWEGAARAAQAIAGALDERMVDASEANAQKKAGEAFSSALSSALGGGQASAAPSAAPAQGSKLSGDMGQFADAIANIESKGSGDYSALGPPTAKGDRAYGKYQVMGANIPQWTQEALGKPMSPQEFLANPQAQDAVFQHRFGSYLAKTGSPADAASMWFTGRPLADAQNAHDVNGTTGGQYVSKFLAGLPSDRSAVASNIDFGGTVTPQQAAAAPAQRGPMPTSGDINYGGDTAVADTPAAGVSPVQYQPPGQAAPAAGGAPRPANPYAGSIGAWQAILDNPYSTPGQKMIAQQMIQKGLTNPESFTTFTSPDGDLMQRNTSTGQITMLKAAPNREGWHRVGDVQVSDSGKTEAYPNSTPEPIRLWQAANADRKARGMPELSFDDWSAQRAQAGRTQVINTNQFDAKGEGAEAVELGKGRGARANEMETAGANAPTMISRLNLLENLLDKTSQGAFGPAEASVASWAQALGVDNDTLKAWGINPNQAIGSEAATKLTNEMTVGMIGKGGFPANNFSDADRAFLRDILPKLANRPEANKIAIGVMRAVEQRKADLADRWLEYQQEQKDAGKVPSFANFEGLMRQRARTLPDMFADVQKQVDALPAPNKTGAAPSSSGPAPAGAVKGPAEAPKRQTKVIGNKTYFQENGQWFEQ